MAALGADETARKAAQITYYLAVRKGARADCIAYDFVFLGSIIYYLSNVQINPFRSFRFKVQIFGQSALAGGGGGGAKEIFHRGSKPLSAVLKHIFTCPRSCRMGCTRAI